MRASRTVEEPTRDKDRRADNDRRAVDADERYRDDRSASERRERTRRPAPSLSLADAAQAGLEQIAELIGKEPSGVVSAEPAEDGWLIGVEVVEERRVPSIADLMGLYEAAIDSDGMLVSYRRTRRYPRGRGNGDERKGATT
jgi:hypothetical protein